MQYLNDMPGPQILLEEFTNPYADPPLHVNAHFHTPYSFSAFNDMHEIYEKAAEEDIDVLGITDFATVEGYDEFYRLAFENKKFPLFNIEFMGLMEVERKKGIRINDPNNPGRIYFCGKGLAFPVILNESQRNTMTVVMEQSLKQTRQMVYLLNKHLKNIKAPFEMDFEKIREKYTKGLVRERHIAQALRMEIDRKIKSKKARTDFVNKLYKGKDPAVDLNNAVLFDNEIRSFLLKKGGVAYVEEDESAFLPLQEIRSLILGAQGIPTYPVLLDDDQGRFTEFEKDFDDLLKTLTKNRIYAVELIPARNDFNKVKKFVEVFNEKGFLITFGTEHNTPEMVPLKVSCRNNVSLDKDLMAVNYQSSCILAAHQYLIAKGKPGYLTPEGFPRLEKQDDYIALGNAVIRKFIQG